MRCEIFITSFMSCSTSTTATPRRGDLLDHIVDLLGLDRIAAGGRLVEQQDLRLGRERAGDLQPPQRAVGQGAGGAVGDIGQADEGEQILGLGARDARSARSTDGSVNKCASTLRRSCSGGRP